MMPKELNRYPYRHHGPPVHGSKLEDYLISEASLREDRPELFDEDKIDGGLRMAVIKINIDPDAKDKHRFRCRLYPLGTEAHVGFGSTPEAATADAVKEWMIYAKRSKPQGPWE